MTSEARALPVGLAGLRYPITQVSLAVRDLQTTMELYHRAFGWAPWQVFDHKPPVHHNTQLRGETVHYTMLGAEVYVGDLNFELLEPVEGPNLWTEHLDHRGEGIASIATMFTEKDDGDAVKAVFRREYGIEVINKADIGDHIEYYYLDTEAKFGCLIECGSGHAIDFVKPAQVYPSDDAKPGPSPMSGISYPITQISLVVHDLEARMTSYEQAFGWHPWKVFTGESLERTQYQGRTTELVLRFAQVRVGDIVLELIEPADEHNPWGDFLRHRGEGISGIGVSVQSAAQFNDALEQFAELGVGVSARGSIGQSAEWALLNSERDFKCQIMILTGHAYDHAKPTSDSM